MKLGFAEWLKKTREGKKQAEEEKGGLTRRDARPQDVKWSQRWLADRVRLPNRPKDGVSPGLISHWERGAELPTWETAIALMNALQVTNKERSEGLTIWEADSKKLKQMRKRESKNLPDIDQNAKDQYEFGKVLAEVFEVNGITPKKLYEEMVRFDRPSGEEPRQAPSTVSMWATGRKLPSDETLKSKILPALKRRNVHEAQLNRLKVAHFQDVMKKSLNLAYVNPTLRNKLLEAIIREYEES